MPAERRRATLLAFIRTLEATAQGDVLDLLDIVLTKLFSDAAAVGKKTRLRTIRDLDVAALKLRRAGAVLMDETVEDAAVRAAAFVLVPRADFAHAMEQIDLLIRPPGDLYIAELRAGGARLHLSVQVFVDDVPNHRSDLRDNPPVALHCDPFHLKQRPLGTCCETCPVDIGVEVGLKVVVARHSVRLAAFLTQPHPETTLLRVNVLHLHPQHRADA